MNTAAHQFGIAAAVAGFGTAVQAILTSGVRAGLPAVTEASGGAAELAAGGDLAGAAAAAKVSTDTVVDLYGRAYESALDLVLMGGVAICAIGVAVVLAATERSAARDRA